MSALFPFFRKRRRAFTVVEVIISLLLLSFISAVVIGGMAQYARQQKISNSQQRIEESARRIAQRLYMEASNSDALEVRENGDVLRLGYALVPDVEYAYVDLDNNSETIANNTFIRRRTLGSNANGIVLARAVSRVTTGTPIFALAAGASRELAQMNMRIGDRQFPPHPADDAITGRGFQSFVLRASVMRENLIPGPN